MFDFALEFVVNFFGRLIYKKYAAREQNQLFAAEPEIANREQLFFEADHPADSQQQQQSHATRSQQTDASRFALLIGRQFRSKD